MYGGKFAFQSIELACSGREIYHFLFCFTLFSRANIFGGAI